MTNRKDAAKRKEEEFRVLFENRPALIFCYYIFITAHKMYNFLFRIKDTI